MPAANDRGPDALIARGKHSRGSIGRGTAIALIVLVAVVALGGGAAFAASRFDSAAADRILPGVRVAGVNVGGMTREEAVAAVERRADVTLGGDIRVRTDGASWRITPADLGTRADVDGAVDRAFSVAGHLSLLSRVYHRVADEPVPAAVPLAYSYDRSQVQAFVRRAFDEVERRPVDAGLALVDGQLVERHEKVGQELRVNAALERVQQALRDHESRVRLPMRAVEPKVTDRSLGKTIVVDISENRLYLYEGFDVVKQYNVATAAEGFVTPLGTWSIVNKVENPSWTNPDPTGWGAGMPAYIPPGPDNPLGTRALYLNAPGIRIHGTTNVDSIGTYASHGCIRMLMPDVEALYPLVPIGTPVLVKA
jgi:lipoprotein-anchoring transpeptidase ErfK/SrfK